MASGGGHKGRVCRNADGKLQILSYLFASRSESPIVAVLVQHSHLQSRRALLTTYLQEGYKDQSANEQQVLFNTFKIKFLIESEAELRSG